MISIENAYISFLAFVIGMVSLIATVVTNTASHGSSIKTMSFLFVISIIMFAISFIAMRFGDGVIYHFIYSWVEWVLNIIGGLDGFISA